MRRRLLVVFAMALVVVAAAAVLFSRARVGAGPLEGTDGSLEGQALDLRRPYDFTSDALLFRNFGKKPIIIDQVRVLHAAGPVELLEVRSRRIYSKDPDQRPGGGGYLDASEPTVPLRQNSTIPVPTFFFENGEPGEGLQIYLRLQVTKAGFAHTDDVEVTYHAGGKKHRETFPFSMRLCAPKADWEAKGCPEDAPRGDRALG